MTEQVHKDAYLCAASELVENRTECVYKKKVSDTEVGLFAKRPIRAGEQITLFGCADMIVGSKPPPKFETLFYAPTHGFDVGAVRTMFAVDFKADKAHFRATAANDGVGGAPFRHLTPESPKKDIDAASLNYLRAIPGRCNAARRYTAVLDFRVPELRAVRDIAAGEQILWPYEPNFWLTLHPARKEWDRRGLSMALYNDDSARMNIAKRILESCGVVPIFVDFFTMTSG